MTKTRRQEVRLLCIVPQPIYILISGNGITSLHIMKNIKIEKLQRSLRKEKNDFFNLKQQPINHGKIFTFLSLLMVKHSLQVLLCQLSLVFRNANYCDLNIAHHKYNFSHQCCQNMTFYVNLYSLTNIQYITMKNTRMLSFAFYYRQATMTSMTLRKYRIQNSIVVCS